MLETVGQFARGRGVAIASRPHWQVPALLLENRKGIEKIVLARETRRRILILDYRVIRANWVSWGAIGYRGI